MEAKIEKIDDKRFSYSLEGGLDFMPPEKGDTLPFEGKDYIIKEIETIPGKSLAWIVTVE